MSTPNKEPRTKNQELREKKMKITKFEEIQAWQLSRQLTKEVYQATKQENFTTDYGLRNQITRAAVSVMSNIAEGFNGGSNPEFIRFLRYAQRSCSEVQSQLYAALDQKYINNTEFQQIYDIANKTGNKIGAFIKYLLNNSPPK